MKPLTLTDHERRCVAEALTHETQEAAALCVGIAYSTFRHVLTSAHARLGVASTVAVARELGWLVLPPHEEGT